jgi:hypothetical protein
MAQLNLRDRRLEATIACVGLPLASKPYLDRLRVASPSTQLEIDGVAVTEVALTPATDSPHELVVRLTFAESDEPERLARPARDADGVILLVQPDRRVALESIALRHALEDELARGGRPPVVVHIAHTNGASVPEDELVALLELGEWPRVVERGGEADLDQSLARAVAEVRSALEESPARPPEGRPENPLLGALREAITVTLSHHVSLLETSVSERLGTWLDADAADTSSRFDALAVQVAAVGERLAATTPRFAAVETGLRNLGAAQRASEAAIATSVGELRNEVRELRNEVRELRTQIDALTTSLRRVAGDVAETRVAASGAAARLEPMEKSLSKATESAVARLDRSLQTTAEPLAELARRTAELPTALGGIEERQGRRLERLEGAFRVSSEQMRQESERSEARAKAMAAVLDEIIEGLKRKKGWFG